MSKTHEGQSAGWYQLTPVEARYMGSISALGVALPNEPGLRVPSQEITDIADPAVQQEIDRLFTVAEALAAMPGVSFAGLEHSQLKPTMRAPVPLKLFIAPAEVAGLQSELTIGERAFKPFINTSYDALPADAPQYIASKEGCFSSGPFSVVRCRSPLLTNLMTYRRDGEPVHAPEVRDFGAIVIQHESDHSSGYRAADTPGIRRYWVTRDTLPAYRKLTPDQAPAWPDQPSEDQWEAFSTDATYPYLPTRALREAFAAGYAEYAAHAV